MSPAEVRLHLLGRCMPGEIEVRKTKYGEERRGRTSIWKKRRLEVSTKDESYINKLKVGYKLLWVV
jgi:hypothetical protein